MKYDAEIPDNTTMYQMKVIMVPEGRICQVHDGSAVFIPSKEFLASALKPAAPPPEKATEREMKIWTDCDGYELDINNITHQIGIEDDCGVRKQFDVEGPKMRDQIVRKLNAMDFS